MVKYKTEHLVIFESCLFRTNSLIINNDSQVMVIDPNWLPSEIKEIQCEFQGKRQGRVSYTVFTHADYDHVIAWKAFDSDITIASGRINDHDREQKVLEEIKNFDASYYISRDYPILYPYSDISVVGKMSLDFGEEAVIFMCCEGHSPDDIMFFFEDRGLWVVGDYLSNIELPIIDHDILSYQQALVLFEEVISQAKPRMMVPGHGDTTVDISEMKRRLDFSRQYIESLLAADGKSVQKLINTLPYQQEQRKIHEKNLGKMRNGI